jgi:hypothetical protein
MYRRRERATQVVYRRGVLDAVRPAPLLRRLSPERAGPASAALGAVVGCALIALVDPGDGGPYPTCPTRALLGIDCPACGTLRGLHALSRGRVGLALDHNLLLLVAVPVGALVWWRWVRAALGRPVTSIQLPRWVVPTAVAVATAFAVARNLPSSPVSWLDSGA